MKMMSTSTKTPTGRLAKKLEALTQGIAAQKRTIAALSNCEINCTTTLDLCHKLIARYEAMKRALLA